MSSTLTELFHQGAQKNPEKAAVILDRGELKETITYAGLSHVADEVSELVVNAGCQRETIALVTKPSVHAAGLLVGIMQAPAAYIPLGDQVPMERLHHLIETLGIRAVFIQDCLLQNLREKLSQYKPLSVTAISEFGLHFVLLSGISCQKWTQALAYVMTTSGTTGTPKLVRVPHECIVPNITHMRSVFHISPEDVVFSASPLTFDPSVVEMLITLSRGATLLLVPDEVKLHAQLLSDILIHRNQVTVIQATPTLISRFGATLLRNGLLAKTSKLHVLAFGGEACPSVETLQSWRGDGNKTEFYNVYGTTEVSCWASIEHITSSSSLLQGMCSIGKPLEGTILEVRNQDGEVLQYGEGELFIGGTDRVCLLDGEDRVERGMLRSSGDLVWLAEDGNIWYKGRLDDQIKRHGKRMNLTELEEVACQLVDVNKAVAIYTPEEQLYLFVHTSGQRCGESELQKQVRRHLVDQLPAHYLPDEILPHTEAFPLKSHGKVDKCRLRKMASSSTGRIASVASRVLDINSLVSVWKEEIKAVLNVYEIDGERTMIALGGNSLQMTVIVQRMESLLDSQLPWLLESLIDRTIDEVGNELLEHHSKSQGKTDSQNHSSPKISISKKHCSDENFPRQLKNERNTGEKFLGHENSRSSSSKRCHNDVYCMRRINCAGCFKCPGCGRSYSDHAHMSLAATGVVPSQPDLCVISDHISSNTHHTFPEGGKTDLSRQQHLKDDASCISTHSSNQTCLNSCHGQCCLHSRNDSVIVSNDGLRSAELSVIQNSHAEAATERTLSVKSDGQCQEACFMSVQRAANNNIYVKYGSNSSLLDEETHHNHHHHHHHNHFHNHATAAPTCDIKANNKTEMNFKLRERWKFDTEKCVDASPLVVTDLGTGSHVAYIGSHSHWFFAIDMETGQCLWKILLGDRIESSACLSKCASFVLVGCYDGHVYALERRSGSLWWEFQTGSTVKCSPTVDPISGNIYVGSHDQHCYALDITCKQSVWDVRLDSGSIFASPAVSCQPHHVYIATLGGILIALAPNSGETLWHVNCGKPLFSSPAVSPAAAFMGCVDGHLYSFSHTGEKLWTFKSEAPIFSSPCLLPTPFSSSSPSAQRTSDILHQTLPPVGCKVPYLVFGSHDGYLYCLAEDGLPCWKYKFPSPVYATPYVSCNIVHTIHQPMAKQTEVTCQNLIPDVQTDESQSHSDKMETAPIKAKRQGSLNKTIPAKRARSPSYSDHHHSSSVGNDGNAAFSSVPKIRTSCLRQEEATSMQSDDQIPFHSWNLSYSPGVFDPSSHFVIACCTSGILTVIDMMTGEAVTTYQFPGETFSSPVYVNGHVVVGCRDDYVYNLRLDQIKSL